MLTVLGQRSYGQSAQSMYLFHLNPFQQVTPQIPTNKRHPKTRLDLGLVLSFYNNDPHYTNSTQNKGSYTFGAREEFPILRKASILVGFDFLGESFTFNSYYFENGYSLLYDGNEIYNHNISMDEFQFPLEWKSSFTPEGKNVRTFYFLVGYVYRLLVYDNSIITNTNNGRFVYEGQNDLSFKYPDFNYQGSSIIELGLGYQRNTFKNGNAFFIEFDYKYGLSPFIYTGNNQGTNYSNYVLFTLNTLSIKLGFRL
ncbi:MAG TPA: hypothetical protein VNZ45_05750 [Bacteroidia bacterium]|nr:hypothetical protein [Bacteroidia bacterium]